MTLPLAKTAHSDDSHFGLRLGRKEFNLFRELIAQYCGIRVADTKRLLLQNRIGRRVRALRLSSFREYYSFVCTAEGQLTELTNLWSAITTNETHFFREPHHFEILRSHLLPELVARRRGNHHLRIWSAGCSTGQEAYTLAIVVEEFLAAHPGWDFSILGSDIDRNVLATAQAGAYPIALKREIPSKHFRAHFETDGEHLRVRPELKRRVKFRCHNLAEVEALRPRVDLIFCRNAIMYLLRETRLRLVRVFRESLLEGGYLLVGSAESLHGLPRIFSSFRVDRTLIYQRDAAAEVDHA